MAIIEYTTLSLPTSLVEELMVWRMAFEASYGRDVSYADMIRSMLDSLELSEPGVVVELDAILKRQPELLNLMANYRGE